LCGLSCRWFRGLSCSLGCGGTCGLNRGGICGLGCGWWCGFLGRRGLLLDLRSVLAAIGRAATRHACHPCRLGLCRISYGFRIPLRIHPDSIGSPRAGSDHVTGHLALLASAKSSVYLDETNTRSGPCDSRPGRGAAKAMAMGGAAAWCSGGWRDPWCEMDSAGTRAEPGRLDGEGRTGRLDEGARR